MSEDSGRRKSRLSWRGRSSTAEAPPLLERLAGHLEGRAVDMTRVVHAYEVAAACHEGQKRQSGEPYITHPVEVATILAELGMDEDTIVAGLLHDTVEDTPYTLDDVRGEFGDTVALLVDGVTKLDKMTYGDAAQAETVRKMVIAMSKDIRVLIIKLADRLHNARTWQYVPKEKSERKAKETLEIYAPLANRLGMSTVKSELEDRSFKTLYPEIWDEIDRLVTERAPEREAYIKGVKEELSAALKSAHIKFTLTGRPKHYYSIYQKMILRGKDFDDIYDLIGLRVLVETTPDCYAALGVANTLYTPIQGRIKDYIASPKFNLYQSLHTTVIGPDNRSLEIQIRTYEMHRQAEYGIAAHWRYKQNPNATKFSRKPSGDVEVEKQLNWLRQLVDWQRETADPSEFLESLSYEISGKQVYVFTPQGEILELPIGSTPVDFAYTVHTEVGNHTIGAKVNDRLVTLDHKLESGDTVEIITSKAKDAGPSRDWLDFVVSPRARAKIKAWFRKSRRDETLELGKEKLAREMRRKNQPLQRLMSHETLGEVAREFGRKDVNDLYLGIGEGGVSADSVVRRIVQDQGGEAAVEDDLTDEIIPTRIAPKAGGRADEAVVVQSLGAGDVEIKLAKCCMPVPPDEIVGFVTRGHGLSIHRKDCPNVESLMREPERFIPVAWADSPSAVFDVQIQVDALDRQGLLADISRVLLEDGVEIAGANIGSSKDRQAHMVFTVHIGDPRHLERIITDVRKVESVYAVYRVNNAQRSPRPQRASRNQPAAAK